MIRAKAKELSAASTGSEGKNFSAGWLAGFTKRYNIRISPSATVKEHHDANNELMEKILYDWLVNQQKANASISGAMVRAKAEELSKACSPGSDYNFTIGWLDGFKKRFKIRLSDRPSLGHPSHSGHPPTHGPTNTSPHQQPQPHTSEDVKPFQGIFFPHKL